MTVMMLATMKCRWHRELIVMLVVAAAMVDAVSASVENFKTLWRIATSCRSCYGHGGGAATSCTEFQKSIQHKNQFHSIQLTMTIIDVLFYLIFAMDLFLLMTTLCLVMAIIFISFAPPKQPSCRCYRLPYHLVQCCQSRRHRSVKGFIESF